MHYQQMLLWDSGLILELTQKFVWLTQTIVLKGLQPVCGWMWTYVLAVVVLSLRLLNKEEDSASYAVQERSSIFNF